MTKPNSTFSVEIIALCRPKKRNANDSISRQWHKASVGPNGFAACFEEWKIASSALISTTAHPRYED